MKIFQIILKEIKDSYKGILIFTVLLSLFFMWFVSFYDPELFAGMEDILDSYPDAIKQLVGDFLSLTIFSGYINVYLFALAWFYFGLYFIMKTTQDIPKEIQNKTIDLVLSKPIKRWKFVIGKYFHYVFLTFFMVICVALCFFLGIFIFPNVNPSEVYFIELIVAFIWLFVFLVALISTSLILSTFLKPRRALALGLGIVIFFYIIGAFWENFDESLQGIKYTSIFYYFETSNLLVNQVWDNVLRDILILTGYSVFLVVASILIFNRRDIPV